jgi:hypothetical protein
VLLRRVLRQVQRVQAARLAAVRGGGQRGAQRGRQVLDLSLQLRVVGLQL